MSTTELDHLIKMINQIADNIAIGEDDEARASKVVDHVKRFWAPSMRDMIIAQASNNAATNEGRKLNQVAQLAVSRLQVTAVQR